MGQCPNWLNAQAWRTDVLAVWANTQTRWTKAQNWVGQCSNWVGQCPPFITCFRRPCTCEWLKNAKTADSMLLAAVNFFFFDQIISSPTILLALGNTQCVQNHFEVVS